VSAESRAEQALPEAKLLHRRSLLAITIGEQVVRLGFQFGTLIALGARLEAEAFGAAALMLAVVNFVYLFTQSGVEQACIRGDHTPAELLSTASALTCFAAIVAVCLTAVGVAVDQGVAGDATRLMASGGLGLLGWSVGAMPRAELIRSGAFVSVSIGGVVGSVVNLTAAVFLLRYSSDAYVPLLASSLAILATSIWCRRASKLAWPVAARPHVPADVRRFMLDVSMFNGVVYAARNGDTFLVAGIAGLAMTGSYDRAYALHQYALVISSIVVGRVVFLWLVDATRASDEFRTARLREAYVDGLQVAIVLSAPACYAMIAIAPELMTAVYAERMPAAGELLRWLALAGVAQGVQSTTGAFLQATGGERAQLQRGTPYAIGMLATFGLALAIFGVEIAAASIAAYSWISTPLILRMALRTQSIECVPVIFRALPAVAASALALPATRLAYVVLAGPALVRCGIAGLIGIATGGLAVCAICQPRLLRDADRRLGSKAEAT
jgi:O-antigen/teichoic acid export membrane protein